MLMCLDLDLYLLFFFFSSRRRHTRCLSDWSSDVCSSDLLVLAQTPQVFRYDLLRRAFQSARADEFTGTDESSLVERMERSEERRVGKECRSRWRSDP